MGVQTPGVRNVPHLYPQVTVACTEFPGIALEAHFETNHSTQMTYGCPWMSMDQSMVDAEGIEPSTCRLRDDEKPIATNSNEYLRASRISTLEAFHWHTASLPIPMNSNDNPPVNPPVFSGRRVRGGGSYFSTSSIACRRARCVSQIKLVKPLLEFRPPFIESPIHCGWQ